MIPLFKPTLHREEEIIEIARVMQSGWWAQGPEVEAFEAEFAENVGVRYAVAVNSGTMALKLAAAASGLVSGTVVCPAITFISTALVMRQLGNHVVFADVNEDSLTLNWASVLNRLGTWKRLGGPHGIVPVWYAGHVYPLPQLNSVKVIEDCAHASGSQGAGQLGQAAAWSFQAVKNLATGDGGMVTTDDELIAREVRRMRWVGIDRSTWDRDKDSRAGYGWDYDIRALDGEKAHMNDITAAIGRVQLRYLDGDNSARRYLAECYNEAFADLEWLRCPELARYGSQHLYVIRVDAKDRDRFIRHMIENGVSAGVHYKPLTHYQDNLRRPLFGIEPEYLPVTERVWKTLVTLPLYPTMTSQEHQQVIDTVRKFPV